MWRGISLANKCLLLFGGAVVLIVLIALTVPWLRMNALVDAGQLELSRQQVATWEQLAESGQVKPEGVPQVPRSQFAGVGAAKLTLDEARKLSDGDAFLRRVVERFVADPNLPELNQSAWNFSTVTREYRYAKAIRGGKAGGSDLTGVIMLERRSLQATRLLLINAAYLLTAGTFVLTLATIVFYQITHRLILGPVRALRETAERVREGNLTIRSDISTGDEFEELADTFNSMLADLSTNQDQLRAINAAMDHKITELSEINTALHDSAKLKEGFVSSMSHELRTPLNSILGFAELLQEFAKADAARAEGEVPTTVQKRLRYAENIQSSARHLLDMINDILEMARIESGRVEIRRDRVVVRDLCDILIGLILPLADKKGLTLKLEVADDLPVVESDVQKLRQILFNFLSNAVKFTESSSKSGRPESVTLRAERLLGVARGDDEPRIRISVIDTGPGIPSEEQERIFEKFHQISGGHTREHPGTGLGLAISKELATLLQGEIQLVSSPGRGSMFSIILPLAPDPDREAVIRLENRFRGSLTGKRTWASG
jgi:two-component system sensor histidine kinase BarA